MHMSSLDMVCAACGHSVVQKGEPNTSQYWQCEKGCRCLMQGCVPYDPKYEGIGLYATDTNSDEKT